MPKPRPGLIRIGVGGWTYEPWRGTFYPKDLAQAKELEYASRRLTSIEINGTYYGAQKLPHLPNGATPRPRGSFFRSKRRASP